jgi:hypothetical protein
MRGAAESEHCARTHRLRVIRALALARLAAAAGAVGDVAAGGGVGAHESEAVACRHQRQACGRHVRRVRPEEAREGRVAAPLRRPFGVQRSHHVAEARGIGKRQQLPRGARRQSRAEEAAHRRVARQRRGRRLGRRRILCGAEAGLTSACIQNGVQRQHIHRACRVSARHGWQRRGCRRGLLGGGGLLGRGGSGASGGSSLGLVGGGGSCDGTMVLLH